MPRLLSLNSYHYRRGGSDVMYLQHEAMFSALGWETAHMAMHHPRNLPSPWAEFFVQEIEFGHPYGPMQKLAMAGKVIYSLEARRRLSALLERFPPDVAHVHCIYHHLSPSVLPLLKDQGIPVVMTAHDLKLACPAYKMFNRRGVCERCRTGNLLHLLANRCIRDSRPVSALIMLESATHKLLGLYRRHLDRVVVPSNFYKQKLIDWGWQEEQLTYIPNYINASAFRPSFQPGDYFFYFGRLAIEKGLSTLIRAASEAQVKLRIAGTGPEESTLRFLAEELGGDIQFLGFVSGDRLWQWVREARAVVVPSEWYENAPMSVLEAYAGGKPVIGARIGGIPEMVWDGGTGALFDSGNTDSLGAVLRMFANLPNAEVLRMGMAARDRVIRTFTPKHYLDGMLRLYASLGVPIETRRAGKVPV